MKQLVKNVTTILIIGVFMVTGGCKKDENTPENNNTEIVNNIRNNYLPLKNKEVDSILRTDYGVNNLEKVDIELVKKDPLIFTRVINRDTLSKDFKFLILIKKKDNQIITFAKKQDNKSIHSRWRFLDEGVPRNFPPPVSGGRYPCGHLDGDPNCIHSVHELEEVVVTGRIVDYYEEIVLIISMYPNFECLMDELDIMYAIDWDGEDSIFNAIEDDRQCLRVYYPPNNSGGGNSGGGNNSEGKQEDNIIDKLNNPCAKALLAKAPHLNNDIAQILRETFGTNHKYHITVTAKPLSGMSGYSSFPEVKQNSIEAIIYLNSNMFGTVTQEYVLATIYHEVIHVFLNAEHAKLGETVFNQKYPSVTYQDYPVGNGQQTRRYKLRTDHSRFDAFLEKLAQSIISFNPNFTLERARAIAKEGIVEDFFISPTDATFIQEQKNGTNGTKCP